MCQVCEDIKNSEFIIFQDEDVVAYLPKEGSSVAHIIVATKKHHANIEEAPDYLVAWSFAIANKLSELLFNGLKLQGLNMLVQDGPGAGQSIEHFTIHIIPRFENDGLQLKWNPTKGDQAELAQLMETYKKATNNKWVFETKSGKKISANSQPSELIKQEEGEVDYQIKNLHRLP